METYHTSEHLFSDLSIPEKVTGHLPRHKRTLEGLDAEEIEDLGRRPADAGTSSPAGKAGAQNRGRGSRRQGHQAR